MTDSTRFSFIEISDSVYKSRFAGFFVADWSVKAERVEWNRKQTPTDEIVVLYKSLKSVLLEPGSRLVGLEASGKIHDKLAVLELNDGLGQRWAPPPPRMWILADESKRPKQE
ncbi:hypothetical protein HPP92_012440 [Vanilla planifolia]|uniref:Uncharacterized protein n=1 Tax=Vanilla planifolia TaxID=51239 RepID=A0A835QV62_VANPL|nr:hypothetical protein HPP92_012440 [Vanilla planifolia]